MAYSRSEETLKAMLPDLQELNLGRSQAWLVTQGTPHEWAYKVREALFIAKRYKDRYPKLAEAADLFSIFVDGNKVEARRARNTTEVAAYSGAGINQGLELAGRSVSTSGAQSPFTIIEAWRKSQPSNQAMHFPQAALSDEALAILYKWAQSWKPPLMLMVDGEAVTVGPADAHVVKYAWQPPDERAIVKKPVEPKPPKIDGGEPH
jgi:hypothetical protein